MASERVSPGGDIVASLARGLDVLALLSGAQDPLTLAEVARLADTTRATARRILLTLVRLGYVATDGPTFHLRPKVMELGDRYLECLRLPAIAHPHLTSLAERVRDTCSLTVLDGTDVVYVDRVKAARMLTVDIEVGTRLPAYALSSGRVLLAALDSDQLERYLAGLEAAPLTGRTITTPEEVARVIQRAREDGYAVADQELDPALRSIAAPVQGPGGAAVAAVNVSTHVTRTSVDQLRDEILPELLTAIRAIQVDLVEHTVVSAETRPDSLVKGLEHQL